MSWLRGLAGYRLRWWQAPLALVLLLAAMRLVPALLAGYSWRERDWNQDGRTTVGEFLAAADISTRRVRHAGQLCTDYFALKDGLTVRLTCPSTGREVYDFSDAPGF